MVNTILARRVNHIVAKGDNPAWPKGSKSRGFSKHEDIENALNGNSMSIEHVGSISVQGLCAKPILVIILFSAKRDKYASCEKTLAQNTWKYVQNYADAKS